MDFLHFSFFVSKSLELKSTDLVYKICLNKPICYVQFAIPQIRFLVGFSDSNSFSTQNARLLAGFAMQVFLSRALFLTKYFGLKNSIFTIRFWQLNSSEILKYFWFYCPDSIISKFVTLGVKGNQFRYLRFLVFDIFNFFGGEFYQLFYLNYFDFPGFLVTDFFCQPMHPSSVNKSFNRSNVRLAHIRIFATFFKCLLLYVSYIYNPE